MRPVTFTLDLEDHRPQSNLPKRYPLVMDRILLFLEEENIKGTFFVVGELAQSDPGMVKNIAAAGHEIALHSWDHTPLPLQNPARFREETIKGKELLEKLTGREVMGYRAPVFSLTAQSLWAIDILHDLGFRYSSSVLPATNPLYGLPGAPCSVFRWKNGLLEIPAPVGRLGPVTLPYLGGFYLRYLPAPLIRHFMHRASPDECLWLYCHPYDFDAGEKNFRIKGAPAWVSLLLWFNRRNSFTKMQNFVTASGKPFAQMLAEGMFDQVTKTVDPASLRQ